MVEVVCGLGVFCVGKGFLQHLYLRIPVGDGLVFVGGFLFGLFPGLPLTLGLMTAGLGTLYKRVAFLPCVFQTWSKPVKYDTAEFVVVNLYLKINYERLMIISGCRSNLFLIINLLSLIHSFHLVFLPQLLVFLSGIAARSA